MLDKDNRLSEEAINSNFGISDAAPLASEPSAPAAPTNLVATAISSSVQAGSSSAPTIAGFSPMSGLPGTRVTISGTNLNVTDLVDLSVLFNGTEAIVDSASATSIVAVVQFGATTGPIQVITPGGTATSPGNFTVATPAPAISSFSPVSGRPGTLVSIIGTGFTEITIVKFNGVSTPFTRESDTLITATVPRGATSGPIEFLSPTRTVMSPGNFMVQNALPTISGFSPTSGRVNDSLRISGTNLNSVTRVSFNGVNASFSPGSDSFLTVFVPRGATSGPITLDSALGTVASPSNFTLLTDPIGTVPTITGFAPTSGLPGREIDVTGTNFGGITSVQFNGVFANFTVFSANLLQATVPLGATKGTIRVSGPHGSAISTADFTIINDLVIPSVRVTAPNGGERFEPGQQVLIQWQSTDNMGVIAHDVKFSPDGGGTFSDIATNLAGSAQSFPWTVPNRPTTQAVVQVIARDGAGNTGSDRSDNVFTIQVAVAPAPVVTSVNPASGPLAGGTQVTINGQNFVNGAQVRFGGVDALSVTFLSSTQLVARTPATTTAGAVNVRAVNPDGQSSVLTGAFEYVQAAAPRIFSINPNHGPLSGGTSITIVGENFVPGSRLVIGGQDAKGVTVSADGETLTARTPSQTMAGKVNVRVVTPTDQRFVLENGFEYDSAPVIREVSPNAGPAEQDPKSPQVVSIFGAFFQSGAIVLFGEKLEQKQAKIVRFAPDGMLIDVEVPVPAAKGVVPVTVRNLDGQEAKLMNAFTYLGPKQAARPRITKITPLTILEGTETPVTLKGLNLKQAFDQGLIVVRGPDSTVAQITISGESATTDDARKEDTVSFTLRVDVPGGLGLAQQLPLIVTSSLRPNAAEDLLLEGNSVMLSTVSKTLPVPLGFTANVSEGGPNLVMMVGRNLGNTRLEVWRGNTQLDLTEQQASDEVVFGILPLGAGQPGQLNLRLVDVPRNNNPVRDFNLNLLTPADLQTSRTTGDAEDGAGFELQPTGTQFLVGSSTGQMAAVRVNGVNSNGRRDLAIGKPVLNSKRLKPGVSLQLFSTSIELALFDRAVILPAFSRSKAGQIDLVAINIKVGKIFALRALSLLLFVRVGLEVQTSVALVPVFDPFNDIFFPDSFNDFTSELPSPFSGFPGAILFDIQVFISVSISVIFLLGLIKPKQAGQSREQVQVLVAAGIGVNVGDGGITLDGGITFDARINSVTPLGGTPKVRHLASTRPVPDEAGFRGFYFAERAGTACLPYEFDVTLTRRSGGETPEERRFVYRTSLCARIDDNDDLTGFRIEPPSLTLTNGEPPVPVIAKFTTTNKQLMVPEQIKFSRVGPEVVTVQEVDAADNALVTPIFTGRCQVRATPMTRGPQAFALLSSPDLKFEVEQLVYSGNLPQAYKEINVDVGTKDVTVTFKVVSPEGKEQPLPAPPKMLRVGVLGDSTDNEIQRRRRQTIVATVEPKSEVDKIEIKGDKRLVIEREDDEGRIILRIMGAKNEKGNDVYPADLVSFMARHRPSGKEFKVTNVAVVVPTKLKVPHPVKRGMPEIAGVNRLSNAQTKPPVQFLGRDVVMRTTDYIHTLTLEVTDQFDNPVGDLYAGSEIGETIANPKMGNQLVMVLINQQLSENSTYPDPVGVREPADPATVNKDSNDARTWIASPPLPLNPSVSLQTLPVQVDGFPLKPAELKDAPVRREAPAIINRTVEAVPPYLFIYWPPEQADPSLRPPRQTPRNLKSEVNRRDVTLRWEYNSDIEEGFVIEDKRPNDMFFMPRETLGKGMLTKTVKQFLEPTMYRVKAFNKDGRSDPSNVIEVLIPLMPPFDLQATLMGNTVQLAWKHEDLAGGFVVERVSDKDPPPKLFDTMSTDFTDMNVAAGTTYTYRVKAFVLIDNKRVESAFSAPSRPVTVPAASPQVSITGITPVSAAAGTQVTITGTGFGGATTLKMGDTVVPSIKVDPNGASIVFTVPPGVPGGMITVTTGEETASSPFTVLAPEVKLSVSPAAQTIVAGQSASYTITLNRTNFTGPVNFAVSGLPAGATAAFTPNPVTGTSGVLTVTTAASTPGGSYNLTLSGSAAGAIVTPAAVSLTVTALVTLSASPSPVSVLAGQSASYTVTLNRGSFTGAVPLAVSGLPLGATVVLNPGFTTGNSAVLVVNTALSTAPGSYALTLTGTAQNALVQSTTVGLTVTSNLPVITGFSPSKGAIGTPVTIVGANFTQVTAVRFTGGLLSTLLDATFTVDSPTVITTFVPGNAFNPLTGPITGPISVTAPQGTAVSASPFTVVAPKDKEKESEGGKLLKDRRDGKGLLTEGAFQAGGGLQLRATDGPAAPAGRQRHFIGQDLRPDFEDSALKGEPDLTGPAASSIVAQG